MLFPDALIAKAGALLDACRSKGVRLATAESCTGGLIAALLTEIPGSSEVLDRGFVTYSNQAKREMLGVADVLLNQHGAVSAEVARAMVAGALHESHAQLGIAVTGIAGPDGGTDDKPVGLVYFSSATNNGSVGVERFIFKGDRTAIRLATVDQALTMLMGELEHL